MSDRIVFLDYDGVLCHRLIAWLDRSEGYFNQGHDKTVIRTLARLQRDIGFKFVSCSRAHTEPTRKEQEAVFYKYGHHLDFHADHAVPYKTDITESQYQEIYLPRVGDPLDYYDSPHYTEPIPWERLVWHRGFNIQSWLNAHPEIGSSDYLVLDDSSDMYPLPKENHILIRDGEMTGGLNMHQVLAIYKFFGVRPL